MGITGIEDEKCIACGTCLTVCNLFSRSEEQDKIIFKVPKNPLDCNLCGQCIAVCPEDAILYDNIGEAETFKGVDHPEEIADYDTVYNIMRANRSVRSYKKDKVPLELLKKVFSAMQMAPTGGNMRLEKFIIVSNQEKLSAFSDAVIEELLKDPMMGERYGKLLPLMRKRYKIPVFLDAPHVIFVTSSMRFSSMDNNIGIIITYGRLAAQALGLGTCWNGLSQAAMRMNPDLMKMIGIRGKTTGVFVIGYPNITFHRAPPRSSKTVKGLED
jgi:nitroreductase/NAD-dependent dihydropyrimidine dehydrogenase PreA subunit